MTDLMTPLELGELTLPNRIVMAPLTRARTGDERVPTELNAEYYSQRAGAGLIISEATSVSPQGVGYHGTPGIWNDAQVAGWQKVTEAVHAAGGRIVLQLWHVGRISDPELLGGEAPVAPAPSPPPGAWHDCGPSVRTCSRARWPSRRSPASSRTSGTVPRTRSGPASTAWRSTALTAT